MRTTLIVLVALLIATPAMAARTVDVTCTDEGGGVVRIDYSFSGEIGELPRVRAFALEVSVDNDANIIDITDYKTGESSQYGTKGYGIFPGDIDLSDPENPAWGKPVAPEEDRGGTGLGGSKVVLELGSLYAGGDPNAPEASGMLCKLVVNKSCTMTIAEEQPIRGGIVLEDPPGDAPDLVNLGTCLVVVEDECFPNTHSKYNRWVSLGSPPCWCDPEDGTGYQCYGDGAQDVHFMGYRVFTTDLTVLAANWQKKDTDPTLNPCADYARDVHFMGYAVFTTDLTKLATYWQKKDSDLVPMCESVDP